MAGDNPVMLRNRSQPNKGFKTYGIGNERSVRFYELNESDVASYATYTRCYSDFCGDGMSFYINDLFSPALATWIVRFFYKMLFIIPW